MLTKGCSALGKAPLSHAIVLYDLAQVTIPTDNVDEEYIRRPHRWDLRLIRNFMTLIGPIGSVYDFLTAAVPALTELLQVKVSRPYYLCPHCHSGQFPADIELDVENTGISPGVPRMLATVGQDAPFDHGRQHWKRGWSRAEKRVVMGDGAEWIWNIADSEPCGCQEELSTLPN
jgi:hypothetical protein